jgi:hypothetical protein
LRRYQTTIMTPSYSVRGMPGFSPPSADGDAVAAAAAAVFLIEASLLPPSVSMGQGSNGAPENLIPVKKVPVGTKQLRTYSNYQDRSRKGA